MRRLSLGDRMSLLTLKVLAASLSIHTRHTHMYSTAYFTRLKDGGHWQKFYDREAGVDDVLNDRLVNKNDWSLLRKRFKDTTIGKKNKTLIPMRFFFFFFFTCFCFHISGFSRGVKATGLLDQLSVWRFVIEKRFIVKFYVEPLKLNLKVFLVFLKKKKKHTNSKKVLVWNYFLSLYLSL